MTTAQYTAQDAHERRSAVLVIIVTGIALLLGWGIMSSVTTTTTVVEREGVTAMVPAGWIIQDGTGALLLVARNPRAMDELYRVSLLPAQADLEALATTRHLNRYQNAPAYRLIETTPIVFDGRDGYKVTYAFADGDNPGKPVIVEGVEYYFSTESGVLAISFEAESDDFAADLPRFQQFLRSVTMETGG